MEKQTERRKYKRYIFTPEDGIVGIFYPPNDRGKPVTAEVINLSEGGIQLTFKPILKNRIHEGDKLLLTEIRGKKTSQVIINVDTEVRWITEDKLKNEIGIGCEFHEIIGENRKKISKFVEFWYMQRVQS
jgi:c-di-GMP-binding flagellar brake protein YcgR